MTRLGELDFPDRMAGILPVWASQLVFALFCLTAAGVMRLFVEMLAPGAAPFALTFPAVLIATLFARWASGLVTLALLVLGAWYFVLPESASFDLPDAAFAGDIAVSALSGLGIVAVGEVFRRVVRHALAERDARIAERDLLLREIDHRMRNNFASVVGLIDMQRRRAADPATQAALAAAVDRIASMARAHNALYRGGDPFGSVDAKAYLGGLCEALASALFLSGSVRLLCSVEAAQLPRDRAPSLGLLTNELVTNAAKHAFVGRDQGAIAVRFVRCGTGYRLSVADDGVGMPTKTRAGSLGMRLVAAFAKDVGGTFKVASGKAGTTVTIDIEP